ncbi:hypothetical protein EV44_g3490 [Erysiphe necator]|uniref:Uncharacterized protein n=1 Tax=Uncinula necator TaxID=52586 RepID=A0A0B1P645_UNCNE|nr:hypothetical protein EV44_g3490 [Erysiphe necator]
MLRGLALDYYYTNIATHRIASFDQVCDATRKYFEGPEFKRNALSLWNALSFKSVMETDPGKSAQDCLQILVKELGHLQHGLDSELRTNKFLHNKIINGCQDVAAFQLACFKPSETMIGLLNDLRSSIATYEKLHGPIKSETFFTDRRYRNQDPRYLQKSPSSFSPSTLKSQKYVQVKKCFVYHIPGCRFTRHNEEDKDKSIQNYKRKFNKRFDQNARQYIIDFEGKEYEEKVFDDTSDAEIDNERIDALIFDVDTITDNESDHRQYFTALGPIKDAESMAVNLANKSFVHATTKTTPCDLNLSSHVTPQLPSPFSFTSSTTSSRYNSKHFYGIMIDTGASKGSTAGYGQYVACKDNNSNINIDTSKAGLMNVQFGIGSTESIGSFILNTPIGTIEFHVVHADTPLLSLADMDKLKIFYTTTLIMFSSHLMGPYTP